MSELSEGDVQTCMYSDVKYPLSLIDVAGTGIFSHVFGSSFELAMHIQ